MEIGEDQNFLFDSDFIKEENQVYLKNCRLAIIDPRTICCTISLGFHLAGMIKTRNPLNAVLGILQEIPPHTKDFDTMVVVENKLSESEELVFTTLTEWFA